MKTKEELNALKKEIECLSGKLAELTEDEMKEVIGGDVTSANIVGYAGAPANGVVMVEAKGAAEMLGAGKIVLCDNCGEPITCPSLRHGTVTCPNCNTTNSF